MEIYEIKDFLRLVMSSNYISCPSISPTRYMYISSNDKVVRAKKGTGGLHLVKTVQAIIIASYAEPVTAEQCAVVTEKLGDYLVSVGY